ncbi:MAG: MOSC domain-containing protein, partial [Alphaproteobacteria bacterium]
DEAARFLAWVAPLTEGENLRPVGLARLAGRGFTDTDFPSVSLMNAASHRAVAQRLGRPLEPVRWRGNIWLEGLAPWEEFDLIGRTLRLGGAVVEIVEPIARCKHTMANPETGLRDTDTLGVLEEGWGHRNFGVYARVIETGPVAEGDALGPA